MFGASATLLPPDSKIAVLGPLEQDIIFKILLGEDSRSRQFPGESTKLGPAPG